MRGLSEEHESSQLPTISFVPKMPALKFVTIANPSEMRSEAQRKTIRSHVAQLHHSVTSKEQRKRAGLEREYKRRKARKNQVLLNLEVIDTSCPPTEYDPVITNSSNRQPHLLEKCNDQIQSMEAVRVLSLADRVLGGGHIDPFRTYPLPFEPFIPRLVHHCKLRRTFNYSLP